MPKKASVAKGANPGRFKTAPPASPNLVIMSLFLSLIFIKKQPYI